MAVPWQASPRSITRHLGRVQPVDGRVIAKLTISIVTCRQRGSVTSTNFMAANKGPFTDSPQHSKVALTIIPHAYMNAMKNAVWHNEQCAWQRSQLLYNADTRGSR